MPQEPITPSLATAKIRDNVARVMVGKNNVVDLLLVALLSDGHVLIEDVPGMGKTVLAKALARSLGSNFQRVQGTPDLLPGDIIGINYFDQKQNEFVFRPGPIFAGILLVDEINRTTPRTQSALLEAMAERQVTIERKTHFLPYPFLVIATQNPIEIEGTFALPEAQLDRFLLRVNMGYPSEQEELYILHRFQQDEPLNNLEAQISVEQFKTIQQLIRQVHWNSEVEQYMLKIVRATRNNPSIQLGVSPRGTLALHRACSAYAAIQGRDYVIPDDVKYLAPYVLAHRIITTTRNRMRGKRAGEIISEILQVTPVPVEKITGTSSKG